MSIQLLSKKAMSFNEFCELVDKMNFDAKEDQNKIILEYYNKLGQKIVEKERMNSLSIKI